MVPKGLKPYKPFNEDPSAYFAPTTDLQKGARLAAQNMGVTPEAYLAAGYANQAALGGLGSAGRAYGYGDAGFQSGRLGQQLGIKGGQRFGEMGAGYGAQAAGLAPQAQRYGQQAADIGQMGLRAEQLGRNITEQSRDYAAQQAAAGQQYARQMTNPYAVQQYMSPYQQAVTDVQLQGAQRQADIAATGRQANAARMGAFGGSRQAVENAEANRALASQMDAIRAQGQQAAYDKAVQAMQYGSNLGLQGLGGAQSGLGTALQGGQLGLSGIGTAMQGQQAGMQGLSTANQLYGTGIQGAQTGLQGVDRMLAGTAQGMQGAQLGLQGVSGAQAGYGLANQSAGQLGQIGQNIYGQRVGNINLQNQLGGQQQQELQAIINQQIQNYATAQQYPMMQLSNMSNLLRGMPMQSTTVQGYQAQPNAMAQLGGLGLTAAGIAGLGGSKNAKGGRIKEKKRPAGLTELALSRMV
jgi:hypothetical protein